MAFRYLTKPPKGCGAAAPPNMSVFGISNFALCLAGKRCLFNEWSFGMTNEQKEQKAGLVSARQAGRLLGLSLERLRQLAAAGEIPRAVKGHYPLVGVVQGYVKYLRSSEAKSAGAKADASLAAARQREIELRIAREEDLIIETDTAEDAARHIISVHRQELAGIGQQVADDSDLAQAIDASVSEIVDRADQRFTEAFSALRSKRDPITI